MDPLSPSEGGSREEVLRIARRLCPPPETIRAIVTRHPHHFIPGRGEQVSVRPGAPVLRAGAAVNAYLYDHGRLDPRVTSLDHAILAAASDRGRIAEEDEEHAAAIVLIATYPHACPHVSRAAFRMCSRYDLNVAWVARAPGFLWRASALLGSPRGEDAEAAVETLDELFDSAEKHQDDLEDAAETMLGCAPFLDALVEARETHGLKLF